MDDLIERTAYLLEEAANEIDQLRDALEHVTELLVDSWHTAMNNDPEKQVAVADARAILARVGDKLSGDQRS